MNLSQYCVIYSYENIIGSIFTFSLTSRICTTHTKGIHLCNYIFHCGFDLCNLNFWLYIISKCWSLFLSEPHFCLNGVFGIGCECSRCFFSSCPLTSDRWPLIPSQLILWPVWVYFRCSLSLLSGSLSNIPHSCHMWCYNEVIYRLGRSCLGPGVPAEVLWWFVVSADTLWLGSLDRRCPWWSLLAGSVLVLVQVVILIIHSS